LSLHESGNLTPEAYDTLEAVMRDRGIDPPARPPLRQDDHAKNFYIGWGRFWKRLLVALIAFSVVRRFLIPSSPREALAPVWSMILPCVAFLGILVAAAILVFVLLLILSTFEKDHEGHYASRSLNTALVITLIIEAISLCMNWYVMTYHGLQ
jgi:hypothetical protein